MAKFGEGDALLKCSFCGKSQKQVKKLIAGPGVYICDECIDLCNEIIDEELTTPAQLDLDNLPRPLDIYSVLNDYVVSQEESKRTLAVAVYNHYKRVRMGLEDAEVELQNPVLDCTQVRTDPPGRVELLGVQLPVGNRKRKAFIALRPRDRQRGCGIQSAR